MRVKKLLSMLLSAVLAVTTLAGCGEGTNYSNEAVKAANEAQSTVVFETDSDLAKSLQDALEDYTQTNDIKTAMVADENLKDLLTSGYQLDIFAAQGEDAEAAAQAIAQQYIVNIVSGKQSEGKIAMFLHKGNGYYYAAVLTYRTGGGSGSGGNGGGSSSDDGDEDNTVVLTGIKVTKNPKIEYWVGDSFETSGMVITAYYSNNTSKDVTLDCSMNCTGFDDGDNKAFKTAGTYKVVFTYQGKTATVTVNVAALKADHITVSLSKDVYEAGEDFDPSTVTVTVKFNNGTTKTVDLSDCTYEITTAADQKVDEKDLDAGKYWLSVSYEGITADSVGFAVEEVYITEILAVDGIKESYYVDDEIELNKVKVEVKYSNGETGWLPIKGDSRFTVSPTKFKTDGITKVLIECKQDGYQELNYSCGVNVMPNTYTVTVKLDGKGKAPKTFEVTAGGSNTFEVEPENGWEVTVVTVNNKNATVEHNGNKVTVSNVQGDVTVTVTLTQMEYNVTLKVVGKGTVNVEHNGQTNSYSSDATISAVKHGEPLKVKATAGQGYEFVSIDDKTVWHKDSTAEFFITGNVTITVTFEEKEPVLTGITAELNESFFVGDSLSKSDLTVYAIYDYDNESKVKLNSSDFQIEGTTKFTEAKNYIIKVSYTDNGKTVTEDVTVHVKEVVATSITTLQKPTVVKRTVHTFGNDDTVFYIYEGGITGYFGHYVICKDIQLVVSFNNGTSDTVSPDELDQMIKDKVIWADPNEFGWGDVNKDRTVTIYYQNKNMDDPVTTEITVRVR